MPKLDWKPGDPIHSPVDPQRMLSFDPQAMDSRDVYKILIGSVIPRPIAFVSTLNKQGQGNLAPFSFFNALSSNPACLMVSITYTNAGAKKDTLRNIEETGEFVVNSANEWMAQPLVHCAAEYPYGVNEMSEIGFTPVPSLVVAPPRVKESAVQFECRTHATVPIGDGNLGSCVVVIGRIVHMHVDSRIYREGKIDPLALQPIARLGGQSYTNVTQPFDIPIPKLPGR